MSREGGSIEIESKLVVARGEGNRGWRVNSCKILIPKVMVVGGGASGR
jgi:hypothetical protein